VRKAQRMGDLVDRRDLSGEVPETREGVFGNLLCGKTPKFDLSKSEEGKEREGP